MKRFPLVFIFAICIAIFSITSVKVEAKGIGERQVFYIDPSYDSQGRNQVTAILVQTTPKLYFYIDEGYWNSTNQTEIYQALNTLGDEFTRIIYPVLISNFGQEWNPGIDNDSGITVLIHPMVKDARGYFRSNDEYPKLQAPDSNEKEMVYLNTDYIKTPLAKSFLAHEFLHLITFNQKDKTYNVEDETWLNEMRAEYVSTLLGYDDVYEGSNLQNRAQIFSENPFDSITEWNNTKYDYGTVNLFTQYLVDHYGKEILVDSLHTSKIGIDSINYALQKKGIVKDFNQIFTDWIIAVFINDCNFGTTYCYLNKNLTTFHVYPRINFLPMSGESTLSFTDTTKDWMGNWFKIIGGKGNLKLTFFGNQNPFKVPYILQKKNGSYVISFLNLDKNNKGEVDIPNFGNDNIALVIIPSIQIKTSGFDGTEQSYLFSYSVSNSGNSNNNSSSIPQNFNFGKNLYFGIRNQDVVYLKIILANEGCVSGLANTNYFGVATLKGVKCLQNKYKLQISQFAGYNIAVTGFVGTGTRVQLNTLLTGN